MDTKSTDIENFLRKLAPIDLHDIPLYVADPIDSDVPKELFPASGPGCLIAGYHDRQLDLALRPGFNGRWKGRGPALALNTLVIRGRVILQTRGDAELRRQLTEQHILAAAVHEMGHILEKGIDLRPMEEVEAAAERGRILNWCQEPTTAAVSAIPAPWLAHDGGFVRNVLHLAYRARLLGEDIPLCLFCDWQQYQLAPIWIYEEALGNELERFAEKSFTEIRSTRPPKEFIDLWRADVARWWKEVKTPSGLDTACLGMALELFRNPREEN